ncbi:hypothetical protein LCGC14_1387120 [marine sediment metagenome]|uniref:PD-(D/E)XK endonuclease-like domain-containing protein n=1 Tax=marine sediment metagenome TaxID=412755 RepID=A0A0F9MGK2_9ZZZZ
MSLRIIHMPPGAGKAHRELLSAALIDGSTRDHSNKYIIFPTRHLLEDRRNLVHGSLGDCYIPPCMMTLNQLATHVFKVNSKWRIFPREFVAPAISLLSGISIGYATLVADFISEIRLHFPDADHAGIRKRLEEAFVKENTPEEVAARSFECLGFMEQFESSLATEGFIDSSAIITAVSTHLDNTRISTLILDGFYELTPTELNFVNALVRQAENTIALVPVSHPGDDLKYCYSTELANEFNVIPETLETKEKSPTLEYFPAKGMEHEAEAIARDIKANWLNSRNRDLRNTWIVFPKLAPYRALIGRVLNRYGIPHCFSKEKTLLESAPYRDLMAMLDALNSDFQRVPFARMLQSPYFENIPAEVRDATPSVSLAAGLIRGKGAWRRVFKARGLLKECNIILKALEPLITTKSTTFGSYLNNLLDVLARLGFAPGEEGLSETEEALGRIAQLDPIFAGSKKGVSLEEFTEAVRCALGASSSTTNGTKGGAGVKISELFEVRGLEPKMLYLGGLKDGDIPAKQDMDLILPDRIRRRLGLVDMNRFMHLQSHIFRRLTATSGKFFLSYPTMEGDKLFLPSIFLSEGNASDLSVKGVYCTEELQTYRASAPVPPKEVSSIAFAKEGTSIRVTDIDSYRSCPRRHFIEKVLGLTPPEVQQYEIDAKELGIIAHRVMEGLISGPLPPLDTFTERAESILNNALANSELDKYLADIMKESFLALLPEIHELESKLEEEGIKSHELEVDVRGSINGINLRGKIDRIDNNNDNTVSLMDYKTGASDISAVSALRGENLQLFIYAAMLAARGKSLKRVGIYKLKDISLKWVPNPRDLKNGNDINTIIDAASEFLKETASQMAHGSYPAQPLKEDRCMNCHERSFCPYIQGTGEGPNV